MNNLNVRLSEHIRKGNDSLVYSPVTWTPEVPCHQPPHTTTGELRQPAVHVTSRTRKLRILLVITRLTVGGDTNVLLDIAHHFKNHPSFEVEIAAGPVPANEVDLTSLAHDNQIPTSIIPSLINRPDPRLLMNATLDLTRLMRRKQYDIVHTHSSVAGIVGRLAAVTARVPAIVHHVHGWGLQDGMSIPVRYSYLGLERLCARFTNCLVAVSGPTIHKGLAHHIGSRDKYALIYNGINLRQFRQQPEDPEFRRELCLDPNCKVVGMIGRLDKQKNPLDFVRAAAFVERQYPQARFLIVGDGTLRAECERLVNELNLQDRCVLLGFRNDVSKILPMLTVLVSTSLWEGLPVAFQEAMCAGKPIVSNDVDGVSDVVREGRTGYLVPPRHPEETADRILRLLNDDTLCNRFGSRARLDAMKFSTEQMLKEIEHLYTQLVLPRHKAFNAALVAPCENIDAHNQQVERAE